MKLAKRGRAVRACARVPSCSEGDERSDASHSSICARRECKKAKSVSRSESASRWRQPAITTCTRIAICPSSSPLSRSLALTALLLSAMKAFARKTTCQKGTYTYACTQKITAAELDGRCGAHADVGMRAVRGRGRAVRLQSRRRGWSAASAPVHAHRPQRHTPMGGGTTRDNTVRTVCTVCTVRTVRA
jgi:hypothetical protein